MKKIVCCLLVLMLVPLLSLADNQDYIVGTWYVYTGIVENNDDVYFEFHIFHFAPDGTVFSSKYDIGKDKTTTTTDFNVIALWTKDNGKYYINLGLQDPQELTIENDTLFFPVTSEYKVRVYKMNQVNYVKDFIMT